MNSRDLNLILKVLWFATVSRQAFGNVAIFFESPMFQEGSSMNPLVHCIRLGWKISLLDGINRHMFTSPQQKSNNRLYNLKPWDSQMVAMSSRLPALCSKPLSQNNSNKNIKENEQKNHLVDQNTESWIQQSILCVTHSSTCYYPQGWSYQHRYALPALL